MTLHAYDGAKQPKTELATIKGDYRVTAGVPVSLFLRRVDERVVDWFHNAVALEPGKHELLVDCVVSESQSQTRYAIDIDVDAGAYRLKPDMAPGNRSCENVHLEKIN